MGSSQTTSPRRVGSGGSTLGTSHSFAGRRAAARRALRHRLVAMRYSQVRSDERPSNDGDALPRGEQGVLQRVFGVADRAQHPIAMHLQFALVRRDELTERLAVAHPRPRDQVIRHHAHARHPPPERPAPHCMDTGRSREWAVGEAQFAASAGSSSSTRRKSHVAGEQDRGGLRSRRVDRRCRRPCLRRGGGARCSSPDARRDPSRRSRPTSVPPGGAAGPPQVDALDEQAIDEHLQSVIERAGRVDISFNAVGIPDAGVVGVPLVDLDVEQFAGPIDAYTRSYFLTARLAARRMSQAGSGVIMRVTALHSRIGLPLVGGYGPAMAAHGGAYP